MRHKFYISILSFFMSVQIGYGQGNSDSIQCVLPSDTVLCPVSGVQTNIQRENPKLLSSVIVPSGLIVGGYLLWKLPALDEVDSWVQWQSQSHFATNTKVENVLIYSTYVSYFGLDLVGVKARNSFKERLLLSAGSVAVGQGTFQLLKVIIYRDRPDGSDRKSFPSAHTGTAFIGAHLLMKEYGYISPWIGVSAYTAATTVGFLRVTNNKHWFSDLMVGAGLGMLSVELSYLLMPYISKSINMGDKQGSLSVLPVVGSDCRGIGLSYTF